MNRIVEIFSTLFKEMGPIAIVVVFIGILLITFVIRILWKVIKGLDNLLTNHVSEEGWRYIFIAFAVIGLGALLLWAFRN